MSCSRWVVRVKKCLRKVVYDTGAQITTWQ